jgi:hypothetical protein
MSLPALASLWSHARDALQRLRAKLMPLDTLRAGERRDLRAWLRALEAFCRRIALIEALAMARTGLNGASPPAHAGLTANAPSKRLPRLRLWPRPARLPVRVTLLGRPTSLREIWRAQKRDALIARLKLARAHIKPAHLRLADRIDALQRFLDAPRAALTRFARKLRIVRTLAAAILARRAPPCPYLAPDRIRDCDELAWAGVLDSS